MLDALMQPIIATHEKSQVAKNTTLKGLTFEQLYAQAQLITHTIPANAISRSDLAAFKAAYERKKQREINRLIRCHHPKENAENDVTLALEPLKFLMLASFHHQRRCCINQF